MIWFRHYSNSDSHAVLSKIKNDLGPKEYGQFWYICEYLASVMEKDTSDPTVTLSEKTWTRNLYCKDTQGLLDLLNSLSNVGALAWAKSEDGILVNVPLLRELVDKRSLPSTKRTRMGAQMGPEEVPRVEIDKNKTEETIENKNIPKEIKPEKTRKESIEDEIKNLETQNGLFGYSIERGQKMSSLKEELKRITEYPFKFGRRTLQS